MRHSFILTLALAVSYSQAEDLLEVALDQEIHRHLQAEEEDRIVRLLSCRNINSVDQIKYKHCYFGSDFYQAQTANEKLKQFWSVLAPEEDGDDEPIGIWYDKLPNFFK